MEQQDLHKRLLIALVLSALVFIGYIYLIPDSTTSSTTQVEQNSTANNNAAPVTNQASSTPKASPVISNESTIATIKSKKFIATIDKFGRISQFTLLDEKYKLEDNKPLALLDLKQVKPLEVRFSETAFNDEAFKIAYSSDKPEINVESSEQNIVLTQKLSNITVTKTITFKPSGEYQLKVSTSTPTQFFVTTGSRPVADTTGYMVVKGALVKEADNTIKILEDGDVSSTENFKKASIVSSFDRYYASLFFDLKNGMDVAILEDGDENPLAFVGGTGKIEVSGYIGPKEYKTLNSISPALTDVIEYGWFTFLAKPFFVVISSINDYVGNWGWAIVIFTIFIKILLFWPTYKGMLSMQKLKDPTREAWDGQRAGPDGATRDYGADDAFPIGDIDDILPGLMEQCGRVYYTMGLNADFDQHLIGWVNTLRGQAKQGMHTPQEFVALDHLLHDMRLYKSRTELAVMRRSAQIAVGAHIRAMKATRPGVHEYEVMAELLHEFHRHRADISYHPIVGGGANACTLHYHANDAELRDGDLLLIDA
ncbi:inner membrane protein translocase component YidC, partial [sediment metagenome]